MAKVYAVPKGIKVPDFDDFFDADGRYDRAADDKAHREFYSELAQVAQSTASGEYVGEVVYFPQGDGSAAYMVWCERPFELVHLPIHDAWRLPEAHERGLRLSDVVPQIEFNRKMKAKAEADDEWWDSQEVGTILHYHNGFGEFVRCEVVDGPWASGLSGEEHTSKHLQPVALVGEWRRHNLRPEGFHAKKVLNREGGWRPNTGNIYEHPDYVGSSDKGINPTDLPALEIGDSNGG